MEMVLRRTEKGFRGKCEGFNVWLADSAPVADGIHILHGDFMISGWVKSSRTGKGDDVVALIIKPVSEDDELITHSGFIINSVGRTDARTTPDGRMLSPGRMQGLVYAAPANAAGIPESPIVPGKVYAAMHKGTLSAYGIPDIKQLSLSVQNSSVVRAYKEKVSSKESRKTKFAK